MFDLKNDFKRIASGHAFELLIVYRNGETWITNDDKIAKLQFETTSEIVERDDKLYLTGPIKAGRSYLNALTFDETSRVFVTKWTDEKLVRNQFTLELPTTDDEPVTCTFGPAGEEYSPKTHALCRFRLFLEPGSVIITGLDSGENPKKDGTNEKKKSTLETILFWCVFAVLIIFFTSVFIVAVSKT